MNRISEEWNAIKDPGVAKNIMDSINALYGDAFDGNRIKKMNYRLVDGFIHVDLVWDFEPSEQTESNAKNIMKPFFLQSPAEKRTTTITFEVEE